MAMLALGIAGSALGGALLPGGLSLLGATLTGAQIGGALASIGGAVIDKALMGAAPRSSRAMPVAQTNKRSSRAKSGSANKQRGSACSSCGGCFAAAF
jgi:hypothetical protein